MLERVKKPSKWVSNVVPSLRNNGVRIRVNMQWANSTIFIDTSYSQKRLPFNPCHPSLPTRASSQCFGSYKISLSPSVTHKSKFTVFWVLQNLFLFIIQILLQPSGNPDLRIQRFNLRLLVYDFEIVHRPDIQGQSI